MLARRDASPLLTLHSLSGNPPVEAWKYICPSFTALQTKQALWSCGRCSSMAGRLPALLVVQKQVPIKDILWKHLGQGVSTHMSQKRKLVSSPAVRLRCLFMQTHWEQQEDDFQAPLLVQGHLLPVKVGVLCLSVSQVLSLFTGGFSLLGPKSHCFGSLLLSAVRAVPRRNVLSVHTVQHCQQLLHEVRAPGAPSLLLRSKKVEQTKTFGSAPQYLFVLPQPKSGPLGNTWQ